MGSRCHQHQHGADCGRMACTIPLDAGKSITSCHGLQKMSDTQALAHALISIDAAIAKARAAKAPAPAGNASLTACQCAALFGLAGMGVDIQPAALLSGAALDGWLDDAGDALCAADYAGLHLCANYAAAHAEFFAAFAQWKHQHTSCNA